MGGHPECRRWQPYLPHIVALVSFSCVSMESQESINLAIIHESSADALVPFIFSVQIPARRAAPFMASTLYRGTLADTACFANENGQSVAGLAVQ